MTDKDKSSIDIQINEDGIISIAESLYGSESEDYKVFKDAAETRKKRSHICIRYRVLSDQCDRLEDVYYYLSKEFNLSVDMIKKIVRKRNIYDPKCRE